MRLSGTLYWVSRSRAIGHSPSFTHWLPPCLANTCTERQRTAGSSTFARAVRCQCSRGSIAGRSVSSARPAGCLRCRSTFMNAPPHSSVSPARRITALSCTLATGSPLMFLRREHRRRHQLVHAVLDARVEPPGLHVDRLDQLGDGLLGALPPQARQRTAAHTTSRNLMIHIRHQTCAMGIRDRD